MKKSKETKKKERFELSPEWKVLIELSKNDEKLKGFGEAQKDAELNKKINWFLFNGATGVLVLIRDNYGDEALNEFFEFLKNYISDHDKPGFYKYSKKIEADIAVIKAATQGLDFKHYLMELKLELIEKERY